jgi:hypothetical protein
MTAPMIGSISILWGVSIVRSCSMNEMESLVPEGKGKYAPPVLKSRRKQTMNHVQINRDPFARASLMRKRGQMDSCRWCGRPGKFYYVWERDSVGRYDSRYAGPFCSVECYRIYFDQRRP